VISKGAVTCLGFALMGLLSCATSCVYGCAPEGFDAAVRCSMRRVWAWPPEPPDAPLWAVLAEDAARRHDWPRYVRVRPPYGLSAEGVQVVEILHRAHEWGLDPAAYIPGSVLRPADAALGLERWVAQAWARFVVDVALGRGDPPESAIGLRPRRARVPGVLRHALAYSAPQTALASVEPAWPVYQTLRAALAVWRKRARAPVVPWPPGGEVLRPGDLWIGVPQLAARLWQRLGWPSLLGARSLRMEGPVLEALRAFQSRSGLVVDGIWGPETRAALDVSAALRVRQIEWALERVRWLGPAPAGRYVWVNVPEYRLWLYEDGRVIDTMAVVVGQPSWPSPLLRGTIGAVEFNPVWHVPRSIAAQELFPIMQRQPGWLRTQQMVLHGGRGLTGARLQRALARGTARLRQRPGPRNALGAMRFDITPSPDVFLHDTPAQALFQRPRRALSHGCVRVERPWDVLAFVLGTAALGQALDRPKSLAPAPTRRLRFDAPVPVVLFYATVTLDPSVPVNFVPDVYGWDAAPRP
jgi:murein L,D-transpeptidase YcbB/YkuD